MLEAGGVIIQIHGVVVKHKSEVRTPKTGKNAGVPAMMRDVEVKTDRATFALRTDEASFQSLRYGQQVIVTARGFWKANGFGDAVGTLADITKIQGIENGGAVDLWSASAPANAPGPTRQEVAESYQQTATQGAPAKKPGIFGGTRAAA